MARTTGDVIVEKLLGWGVDTVLGLPGDGINGIFEALRKDQDELRLIQVCHEEAAAFMACGHAKFTGRLGVCFAASGPGAVHLLNGLHDAELDHAPVLAITGHTYHDELGTPFRQEIDIPNLFKDIAGHDRVAEAVRARGLPGDARVQSDLGPGQQDEPGQEGRCLPDRRVPPRRAARPPAAGRDPFRVSDRPRPLRPCERAVRRRRALARTGAVLGVGARLVVGAAFALARGRNS